jgi:DNA-binding CsgD family transcriptional regulator
VVLDGFGAHVQLGGDLAVGRPEYDQLCHSVFLDGEPWLATVGVCIWVPLLASLFVAAQSSGGAWTMLPTDLAWHGGGGNSSVDPGGRCTRPARVFVGRGPELAALAAALAAARAGDPQVVMVQGEAGIGKSSLISEFLGGQRDLSAIAASGETAEAVLPYGVVQQLAAEAAAASPGVLAGLELLLRGPGPAADPLAVGMELHVLIASLQGSQATAVVVEDLQWADLPSARALLFACRRLGTDRVLVLLTGRPEATSQLGEGWTRFVRGDRHSSVLTLRGLDAGELGILCRRLGRAGLPGRTVGRLAAHTGGNPLLARALLDELTDDELRATGGSFRVPRSLAGLILPRLAALPWQARDLVVAASVLGERAALADAAAVAGTAEPAAALDRAERAGLLVEQDTSAGRAIAFPHLLIRQAVYHDLGSGRRRRLHLRAAAVVGGQEALAHRVAAADDPDAELAAELSAASAAAVDAGQLLLAARYLQQAAAVTVRGPDRDEHALSAFELLVRAADVAAADAARPVIEQLPASARRDTALGQFALLAARPGDADALLRAAWQAHDPVHQPGVGGEAALGLGMLATMSGAHAEAARWLDRALRSGTGSEPWYDAARCIRSFALVLSGDAGRALGLFGDLPARPAMVPAARTDALAFRGVARLCVGDLQAAAADLTLAVNRISAGIQVRFSGPALAFLAGTEFRLGCWDDACGHAELAVALAGDGDRGYDLALVHSAAVPVAACRGDWVAADGHAQAAEQAARTFGGLAAILAASARGILGLARDDPEEVLQGTALALGVPQTDHYDPSVSWWRPAQVWALIRTGHLGQAEEILAAIEARAVRRGEGVALTQAAWLRGSLAMAGGDLDQADQVLRAARCAPCGQPLPFHHGLLDLQHGRCLSRLQRYGAAVDAVHAAHQLFSVLGAEPFVRACEAELAGARLRTRAAGDSGLPGLTSQELRVARLVASGLSNREAAAQLYLSPKTVEYHLAHAFTKLGVRSRHQLTTRILDRDNPGNPA